MEQHEDHVRRQGVLPRAKRPEASVDVVGCSGSNFVCAALGLMNGYWMRCSGLHISSGGLANIALKSSRALLSTPSPLSKGCHTHKTSTVFGINTTA